MNLGFSKWGSVLLFCAVSMTGLADQPNPPSISDIFNKIKSNQTELKSFLTQMPKGGDLHNHLSGSIYAENLIHYGATKGLCLNTKTEIVTQTQPCDGVELAQVSPRSPLYQRVIDAWSLRHLNHESSADHDHFFAIFPKIAAISQQERGKLLADVVAQASAQRIHYLELMLAPDNGTSASLGQSLSPALTWSKLYSSIKTPAFEQGIQSSLQRIQEMEQTKSALLHCGSPHASASCGVKVRYLAEVYRNQPRPQFFAQLMTEFELSQRDSRIVGINFVGPEDGPLALSDYVWQMRALHYLHKRYPKTHISMHAGELREDAMLSPSWKNHITQAIHVGGAERIGHGTAILAEHDSKQLFRDMTRRDIPVEINLTSNRKILHISGQEHPAPLYLKQGVPIVLSTDDAGIFRTSLTEEYLTAVQQYGWDYDQIKQINRNSLTYSFLPGASLWTSPTAKEVIPACREAFHHQSAPSSVCQQFLANNEKAQAQWTLELGLWEFERHTTQ